MKINTIFLQFKKLPVKIGLSIVLITLLSSAVFASQVNKMPESKKIETANIVVPTETVEITPSPTQKPTQTPAKTNKLPTVTPTNSPSNTTVSTNSGGSDSTNNNSNASSQNNYQASTQNSSPTTTPSPTPTSSAPTPNPTPDNTPFEATWTNDGSTAVITTNKQLKECKFREEQRNITVSGNGSISGNTCTIQWANAGFTQGVRVETTSGDSKTFGSWP